MNAGLTRAETIGEVNQDGENNYNVQKILNFKYEKVHSLFAFSENLENWCKGVQNYVRTNSQQFFQRPVGENAAVNMGDLELVLNANGDLIGQTKWPNVTEFTFMCYISPSYELRFLCSHPEFVGITIHKAFRTIYKWPAFIDHDLYCHNVPVTTGWQDKVRLPSIWDGYTDTTFYQNSE